MKHRLVALLSILAKHCSHFALGCAIALSGLGLAHAAANDKAADAKQVPQVSHQDEAAPAPPGFERIDVRDGGLYAEFYVPAHAKSLPVLVTLGGGEGGVGTVSRMSVSFLKHGYAVLALAYWGEPGLPQTLEGVPLEYFGKAIAWLKQRPDIDPARIGLIGWSRGAEAALLIATRQPDIHAVVAVSGSSYVWAGMNFTRPPGPAWTEDGKPVPYVTPRIPANYRPDMPIKVLLDAYLNQAKEHPEAIIPIERINGPILLLSGEDDHLYPTEMDEQIVARLKATHFPHHVVHLSYPGAGHIVFVGDPAAWTGHESETVGPFVGGSLSANTAAWADDWPKVLRFLDDAQK